MHANWNTQPIDQAIQRWKNGNSLIAKPINKIFEGRTVSVADDAFEYTNILFIQAKLDSQEKIFMQSYN